MKAGKRGKSWVDCFIISKLKIKNANLVFIAQSASPMEAMGLGLREKF